MSDLNKNVANTASEGLSAFYSEAPARLLESQKVTSILNRDRFPELTQFKRSLQSEEFELLHYIANHAKKARTYRLIFFGFSILFFFFLGLILAQNATPSYTLFFESRLLAKIVPSTACGILGLFSLLIAAEIQSEKEAIFHLVHKAKQRLNRVYMQKRAAVGWRFIFVYFRLDHQTTAVVAAYHETVDKIHGAKDAALALIAQIRTIHVHEPEEYERLSNQAIGAMQDQMSRIIDAYTSA